MHPDGPLDEVDAQADTSLSFKAICCCVCCTVFIVLAFVALTVLPDELSKHGIDLNEELQKHGIDFLGAESQYNKTMNKTLSANITKPKDVSSIIEKLGEREEVEDEVVCQELHPNLENPYGKICWKCTTKECRSWDFKSCPDGEVYDGKAKSCTACENKFNEGTVECDSTGATKCSASYYLA